MKLLLMKPTICRKSVIAFTEETALLSVAPESNLIVSETAALNLIFLDHFT